jgi:hypothetical protein
VFAQTNISTARSEKLSSLIVKIIAQDTFTYQLCRGHGRRSPIGHSGVEGTGFKQLMAYVEPAHVVPCANTVKNRPQLLYAKAKNKVRERLQDAPAVSMTTDCWTSSATECYISLSAHYVCTKSWTLASWVLATQSFDEHHTGFNIKNELEKLITDWGVTHKITTMVHDNAANMNLASELSDVWSPLACSAHTLQLAVNHAFDKSKVTDVIDASRSLVSHFRHSAVATAAFQKQQDFMKLPKRKLMLHSKTRWNSAFDMLVRLQENRWAVSAVLTYQRITKPAQAN